MQPGDRGADPDQRERAAHPDAGARAADDPEPGRLGDSRIWRLLTADVNGFGHQWFTDCRPAGKMRLMIWNVSVGSSSGTSLSLAHTTSHACLLAVAMSPAWAAMT